MKKRVVDVDNIKIISRIRRQLGHPLITVEISDDMIDECINDAVDILLNDIQEQVYNLAMKLSSEIVYNVRNKFKDMPLLGGGTINPEALKNEK